MSDAVSKNEAATKDEAEASPADSGTSKLLIALVAGNALLVCGLVYILLTGQATAAKGAANSQPSSTSAGTGEVEAEEGADAYTKNRFGPFLDVGTFVTSLASTAGQPPRYAKVAVSVEALNEASKARVESALVPIKTEVVMLLSNTTPKDVFGAKNIEALSVALTKRANKLIGVRSVKRLYFTELIVQ